jgi:hypothetical protein
VNPANWHWPQWVFLVILVLDVGIGLAKHGEQKEGTHSFWVTAIAAAFVAWVLLSGGFFK